MSEATNRILHALKEKMEKKHRRKRLAMCIKACLMIMLGHVSKAIFLNKWSWVEQLQGLMGEARVIFLYPAAVK